MAGWREGEMTRGVAGVDHDAVERYLRALFGSPLSGALVEVRFRIAAGMGRSFHAVEKFDELSAVIAGHAHRRDVFVGVLPRARRGGGGRDLVEQAAVVWADCDGPVAAAALGRFRPRPTMIVASGSGTNCHVYWLLSRPVAVEVIERINRRLALALGADVRSSDAARILRPGGCANWKSWPPSPVRLVALENSQRVDIGDLDRRLPGLAAGTRPRAGRLGGVRGAGDDALLRVSPRVYVQRLTGQAAGRDGKLCCPFHEDRSPSLHVFERPERGWFCFGCRRGGSVYDFAALLWGCAPRGPQFLRLRRELTRILLGGQPQLRRDTSTR